MRSIAVDCSEAGSFVTRDSGVEAEDGQYDPAPLCSLCASGLYYPNIVMSNNNEPNESDMSDKTEYRWINKLCKPDHDRAFLKASDDGHDHILQ